MEGAHRFWRAATRAGCAKSQLEEAAGSQHTSNTIQHQCRVSLGGGGVCSDGGGGGGSVGDWGSTDETGEAYQSHMEREAN